MKNDSTENWLRQTLGGFQPDAPADAWQRLEPNLPEKRRRRPPVFWWKLAAVAAVVAACFWFFEQKNVPPTAPVLEQKQPVGLPPIAKTNVEQLPVLENAEPHFSEEQPPNISPKTAFAGDVFFQKNLPAPDAKLPENAPFIDGNVRTVFRFEKNQGLEKLPARAVALLAGTVSQPELQPIFQPILPVRRSLKPRFWLGFEAAPAIFFQKNYSENPHGLAFAEQSAHPGHGWQTGISLSFQPRKNWRFALGIQHLQQTHETAHTAMLRLMDGVLLNPSDPGLKEYEFRYGVISGGQQSDLTLRLQQQDIGSTMPTDELFMLYMKTVRRSNAWRVPLTIERRFGTGRWQGFVRGGAVVDFAQKSTLQVTHFTEACQDLCFQSGHIPKIKSSTTAQCSVGWLAGAGIERQISRRAGLRFDPFLVGQKGSLQGGIVVGLLFSN